jgi:hypothetical protein
MKYIAFITNLGDVYGVPIETVARDYVLRWVSGYESEKEELQAALEREDELVEWAGEMMAIQLLPHLVKLQQVTQIEFESKWCRWENGLQVIIAEGEPISSKADHERYCLEETFDKPTRMLIASGVKEVARVMESRYVDLKHDTPEAAEKWLDEYVRCEHILELLNPGTDG